jgi:limonene 1,2-monooxygenase
MRMRSGVFIGPLHPLDENPTLAIQRDLELVELLDRLGYEEAWIGEHHSAGWEIISSPELFIAAAVERTKRIRLGTGVISLPYHNPFNVAGRMVQLDHQSHGRAMFGIGPGVLASDALQFGADPSLLRSRMADAIDVIVRLLAGETVTAKTDWFELSNAALHLQPYSLPRPEIAVASVVTPSGAKIAGKYGFGMLCLAATQSDGFDALATNWKVAEGTAAERGGAMSRESLRLMGPVHLAETRDQAEKNVQFGMERYQDYMATITGSSSKPESGPSTMPKRIMGQTTIIGTPDDAIAQIRSLQAQQGEFGCFLQLGHNWADWDSTKKSYELWQRYVMPVINNTNEWRASSLRRSFERKAEFGELMQTAVANAMTGPTRV